MAFLKSFFPFSFGVRDVAYLVVRTIIYLVVGVVFGILIGVLAGIPVLGLVFRLVGSIADIYVLAGLVVMYLDYFKVFND